LETNTWITLSVLNTHVHDTQTRTESEQTGRMVVEISNVQYLLLGIDQFARQ
jgi:hypothetical protein